jgi:hypothetical protein
VNANAYLRAADRGLLRGQASLRASSTLISLSAPDRHEHLRGWNILRLQQLYACRGCSEGFCNGKDLLEVRINLYMRPGNRKRAMLVRRPAADLNNCREFRLPLSSMSDC